MSSTMIGEQYVNPAIPMTVGALLAEEVTMDPLSPLPSFLEMKMMDEANSSAQRVLQLAWESAVERLSRIARSLPSPWRARTAQLLEYTGKRYGQEVLVLITYMVNRHYLRSSRCASFAESLYGGRRAKLGATDANGQRSVLPLTDVDKTRLALVLALGPYIQVRLDQIFRQQQDTTRQEYGTLWAKLGKIFVTVYPFSKMITEGIVLGYQWLFLVGKTVFFHPTSHMLRQIVRRTTLADASQSKKHSQSTWATIRTFEPLRKAVVVGVGSAFVLGWLRQFRNLLRSHDQRKESIPPYPAPIPLNIDPSTRLRQTHSNPTLCPLCRQPRINPAVATSGYVCCQRCLVTFVREYGKCPLTGVKCTESNVVRIYEPNALS